MTRFRPCVIQRSSWAGESATSTLPSFKLVGDSIEVCHLSLEAPLKALFENYPAPVIGLSAFLASGFIATGLSYAINRAARSAELVHYPGPGRLHGAPVVRIGGMAILPAVVVALLATSSDPQSFLGISICAVSITAVGLVDDLRDLPPAAKLSGQVGVAIAALAFGVSIDVISNPFGGVIELSPLLGGIATIFLAGWNDERHQPLGRNGRARSRRGVGVRIDPGTAFGKFGQWGIGRVRSGAGWVDLRFLAVQRL